MLSPWKKIYDKPRQHIKKQRHSLLTKVHLVKVIAFPVVKYGCENWTIMKTMCQRIYAFELLCWRSLLRVPWTARRSNQSTLKEMSPDIHWKDWCWSWRSYTFSTWWEVLTHWKRSWFWERLKAGGEGNDRGWDGWIASLTWWTWLWANSRCWWWAEKLAWDSSLGCRESDMTEQLNWTEWIEWDKKLVLFFGFSVSIILHALLCWVCFVQYTFKR